MEKFEVRFFDGLEKLGSFDWFTSTFTFDGNCIQSLESWILDLDENGVVENVDIDVKKYGGISFRWDFSHCGRQESYLIMNRVRLREIEDEKKRLSEWLEKLNVLSACKKNANKR